MKARRSTLDHTRSLALLHSLGHSLASDRDYDAIWPTRANRWDGRRPPCGAHTSRTACSVRPRRDRLARTNSSCDPPISLAILVLAHPPAARVARSNARTRQIGLLVRHSGTRCAARDELVPLQRRRGRAHRVGAVRAIPVGRLLPSRTSRLVDLFARGTLRHGLGGD